ncbi:MAG: MFS transporter [Alphaproteobacteria bacterium]|nr:MFS transporter [Alphaproteobacteria bacterium]
MWGGLSVALIGDQMFSVVRSWVAASVFGTSAGGISAAMSIGMLTVALFSGAWADRVEHRRMMILADLLRVGALFIVAASWAIAGAPLGWSLFVGVFLMAIGMGLYRPAMQTVLPGIVRHPDELPAANALIDTTDRLSRLLGPAIVGAATAIAPLWAFVAVAGLGFAASAASTRAILRGFRVLRPHALLWFMLIVSGWINGAWFTAFFVALPLIIEQTGVTAPGGGGGLAAYGYIMMGYGGVNLLSTLITGSRGLRALTGRTIFWGNHLLALGIAIMALAAILAPPDWRFAWLFLGSSIAAIGGPMHDITVATLRQLAVPGRDMGSAVRAFMMLNHFGALIAMMLAPSILDTIGLAATTLVCAVTIFIVAAFGMVRFPR